MLEQRLQLGTALFLPLFGTRDALAVGSEQGIGPSGLGGKLRNIGKGIPRQRRVDRETQSEKRPAGVTKNFLTVGKFHGFENYEVRTPITMQSCASGASDDSHFVAAGRLAPV